MVFQLWIDVLLRAGVPVEVCRVEDEATPEKKPKVRPGPKKGTRKRGRPAKKRKREESGSDTDATVPESEEDQLDESQYALEHPGRSSAQKAMPTPPTSQPKRGREEGEDEGEEAGRRRRTKRMKVQLTGSPEV